MYHLIIFILIIYINLSYGEVNRGYAYSDYGFAYLSKFCFDYTPKEQAMKPAGKLNIQLNYHTRSLIMPPPMSLLIFDDEESSWPAIYSAHTTTCYSTYSKAKQVVPVHFDSRGHFEFDTNIFEHVRPRFWYVALVNCNRVYGVTYSIHWTTLDSEFGVNERGLWTYHLIFLVVTGVLLLVYASFSLKNSYSAELGVIQSLSNLPPIHALFLSGILCLVSSVVLGFCHLSIFAVSGVGLPLAYAASVVLQVSAELLFSFLLLLLAQGWCISTEKLENKNAITWGFGAVGCCYFLLLMWAAGRDRASTMYVYDSGPGFGIIILNILGGLLFAYTINRTREREQDDEKKKFYFLLGVIYIFWFLHLGVVVPIAAALDPWVREKTVYVIQMVVISVSYTGMLYFVWPGSKSILHKVIAPNVSEEYDSLIDDNITLLLKRPSLVGGICIKHSPHVYIGHTCNNGECAGSKGCARQCT